MSESHQVARENATTAVTRTFDDAGDQFGADQANPNEELFAIVRLLRNFMEALSLRIQFDGSILDLAAPQKAEREQDLAAYLRRRRLDRKALLDEFLLSAKELKLGIKTSDAKMGLDFIIRSDRAKRRAEMLERMIVGGPRESEREEAEWLRFAGLWEEPPEVSIAFMKHGLWQIKQKQCGLTPDYHLMLIFYSEKQGAGKSTLIKKFLEAQLEELVPPPALLSDFVDARSGGIYEFPAVILDDIHKLEAKYVEVLKQIMTADKLSRRRLFSHGINVHEQSTTLFATSNKPIESIIPDKTGHRRFFTLTMRSGQAADGGDAEIWDVVNSLDYLTLWNSVPAWGPCPIEDYVHLLFTTGGPPDVLRDWLISLDLESDALLAILTREGVKARALFQLFVSQTASAMTETAFGRRMNELVLDPAVPFSKTRKMGTVIYPIKPEHQSRNRAA